MTSRPSPFSAPVRRYEPSDEIEWTRCRALSFLATAYFDDVVPTKPAYATASIELVAHGGGRFVGLIDITVVDGAATIETIAVHPDHQRSGVGGELLAEGIARLPSDVATLEAWTRDDQAANDWYRGNAFEERYRYLHVYANESEIKDGVEATRHELRAVAGFFHPDVGAEAELRPLFSRVYVCRQYVLSLSRTVP